MLQYLLKATTIWLIGLVLFDVFLRRGNYHGYNRFYLLVTFLSGCFLPLWRLQTGGRVRIASPEQIFTTGNGWMKSLAIIYLAGGVVALSLLIIDMPRLIAYYRKGNKSKEDGWTIVETGKEHPPFSYLDILFIPGKEQYGEAEWGMILSHEKQHSIQLHLIDLLTVQLSRIVFWFHPLVYIYCNRLLLAHEYQADKAS